MGGIVDWMNKTAHFTKKVGLAPDAPLFDDKKRFWLIVNPKSVVATFSFLDEAVMHGHKLSSLKGWHVWDNHQKYIAFKKPGVL